MITTARYSFKRTFAQLATHSISHRKIYIANETTGLTRTMSRKFYYSSRAVLLSAIVLCISRRAKLAAATCSSSVPTEIGMDDVSCSGLSAGTTCDHFCEDGFYSNVEANQTDVCEFFLDENVVFNISRSPAQEVSWTVASKTQGCVQSGALATLLGTYKVNVNVYVGADDDESFGLYLKEYDNLPCIAPRGDGEYYQCQVSFLKKFDGSETLDDFDLKLFDENVVNGVAIKDISTLTFTKVVDQANVCAFVIEDHVNETDVLCNATDSGFVEDGRFVHDNTTGISSCVDSAESLNILAGLYEITLQVYGHQDDDYTATYYIDPHGDKIFCNVRTRQLRFTSIRRSRHPVHSISLTFVPRVITPTDYGR